MSRKKKPVPPPRGLPKNLHERWWGLMRFANGISALYGAPVYLVGSCLRPGNDDPRDYDIRVTLSGAAFEARYGDVYQWMQEGGSGQYTRLRWRWSDDMVKRSKEGFCCTGLNVDFQVYPRRHADLLYAKKRRIRLDTRERAR